MHIKKWAPLAGILCLVAGPAIAQEAEIAPAVVAEPIRLRLRLDSIKLVTAARFTGLYMTAIIFQSGDHAQPSRYRARTGRTTGPQRRIISMMVWT
ncbi:MAG: hypothetical protein K0U79_13960 [Gammaproteobacteria bacterium]|nr:hypothetical protein [Gammaproteobacteria bacterium]